MTAIRGVIFYEDGGAAWDIGSLDFVRGSVDTPFFDGRVFMVPGGASSWHVRIELNDEFWDLLQPRTEEAVAAGIGGSETAGFPVLSVNSPFRWSTQFDPSGPVEVVFETFLVTTGCDRDSLACTENGAIQARAVPGSNPPDLTIESSGLRPLSDPSRIDSGPLSERSGADVLWTGQQMVVWGGTSRDSVVPQPLTDGAAFDPNTGTWSPITGPLLEEGSPSRAIWIDGQMMVITDEMTVVGDPVSEQWEQIGSSLHVLSGDSIAIVGDRPFAWVGAGIHELNDSNEWEMLPDPGFGGVDPSDGMLLDFGGHLVATGLVNQNCHSRRTAVWSGSEWNELDRLSFGGCSSARQSVVVAGELLEWSDNGDPTYRYDAGLLMWDHDEGIPLASDRRPGALLLGDRAFVPGLGEGAIYDPATRAWVEVDPPGFADSGQMVWTGAEVLVWVNGRDAWRWTPPDRG